MTEPKAIRSDHVAEHPAFRAWARVHGSQAAPTKIEVLKQTKRKTMVCRLSGSGTEMENVIAKRSFRHYIGVERIIYAEILPSLPATSLRYYGSTEDDDPNYEWLFIEDANGRAYTSRLKAHRIAAGRWLGILHTSSASQVDMLSRLPERGPGHYLEALRFARQWIERSLNLELELEDLDSLQMIISDFDRLEGQWSELLEFCDKLPLSLVHGDFKERNIRIRSAAHDRGVPILVAFDWAEAGRGVPPVDILGRFGHGVSRSSEPDIYTYWSVARKLWTLPSMDTMKRFETVGKTFRAISAFAWEFSFGKSPIPREPSPAKAKSKVDMWRLRLYGQWLGECLEEVRRF